MSRRHAIDPALFVEQITAHYPHERCHLDWDTTRPWTLLFAVMLSAQCTDARVNRVTPVLFRQFPDLEAYIAQPRELLEQCIHSTGFYRMKARNIHLTAEQLLTQHRGTVPDTMEELTALPGVGRKTANVILWNLYGKNVGFVVDTHVSRIAQRTGLTEQHSPEKIEQDLMRQLPQEAWGEMSHRLVQFGRDTCKAPVPRCSTCFLASSCPKRSVEKSR
ncbi:endonuclease III [Candidatus Peribacteria bacterium]|nr:endonuclease III [Candidatus Peribacteria bacterium]